jgi:two-component sensor histidine kinase
VGDRNRQSWQSGADGSEVIGALSLGLAGADCGVTIQGRDLSYRYIYNLPPCWTIAPDAAPDDVSIYGPHLGEKLALAKAALVATGEAQKLTTFAKDRIVSFKIDQLAGAGQSLLVVTAIHDITHARKREATLRTLLLELSHRSKNLMAIIQGLATQSAKYSTSVDSFIKSFTGRLHAVAGAQDVLVDSNWQGAKLFELARRQLLLAEADGDIQVLFEGDDIELDANQSLHIGLALHELAMSAVAPGRKATGFKRVSLSAKIQKVADRDHVMLEWNSPPGLDEEAAPAGFGSVLLEKVVPAAVSGVVNKNQTELGLTWNLTFPLHLEKPARKVKRRRPGE